MNIASIVVTQDVSHALMSWSNSEQQNISFIETTEHPIQRYHD